MFCKFHKADHDMKKTMLYSFLFVILAISPTLTAEVTSAQIHSAIAQLKKAPKLSTQQNIVDFYLSHAAVASTAAVFEEVWADIEYQARKLSHSEDRKAVKVLMLSITDVVKKLQRKPKERVISFAELSLMQLSGAKNKTARHLAAFYMEITRNAHDYSPGIGEWSISEIIRRMESCLLHEVKLYVYHLRVDLSKFRFTGRLSPQEAYEITRPLE